MNDKLYAPGRFGFHLDSYTGSDKLADIAYLEQTVRGVAKTADMHILTMSSTDVGIDAHRLGRRVKAGESGFSVVALITTSHIALHTWPEVNFLMFDLVSCKEFDPYSVLTVLSDLLSLTTIINSSYMEGSTLTYITEYEHKEVVAYC